MDKEKYIKLMSGNGEFWYEDDSGTKYKTWDEYISLRIIAEREQKLNELGI